MRPHSLLLAAVGEAVTGLALLVAPSLVGQWLLGAELTGVAAVVARALGIALIALALACWPGPPKLGMLAYVAGVALLLSYASLVGGWNGILLWAAVALHLVLTVLLLMEKRR